MRVFLALCLLALGVLAPITALAQDADARAAARCLRRYQRSPASATRRTRGAAAEMNALLGGPSREWSCMPRSLGHIPLLPATAVDRVASCFERARTPAVVQGCAALARALEVREAGVLAGAGLGEEEEVSLVRAEREHASVGELAAREAVAEQIAALRECAPSGTFVVHVRASPSAGEAAVIERPQDASDAVAACVEAAAARARIPRRYVYARDGELWSAVVEVRLGSP
jgi:hypothetical protein